MASRRELLDSISCDMRLDKSFFMKIYGYELTWPGFAEDALTRLEFLGLENTTTASLMSMKKSMINR